MDIKLVTTIGCPVCVITHKKLISDAIDFQEVKFSSTEGKELAAKSPDKHFPMLIVDGEYFCGNEALKKAGSLKK